MTDILKELQSLQPIDHDAGEIFSGKKSKRKVRGFASASSFTPDLNSEYLFHDSSRDAVVWFMDSSDPLYVFGPAGSGKTSLIKQLAAKLNYPVFDITGHGRLEFPDMVGHLTVEDSNMSFQYGPLALAMKFGGLFLLNEIDLLDPATAAGLNGILDSDPLCIAENGGEVIKPHPLFRFAATANTNGGTDETGLYQGTLRQNLAFMDRFWLCKIGYPKPKDERELLHRKAPKLPKEVRTKMVEFANEIRKLFMGEADGNYRDTIEVTFSTRTLIRWADLTVRFQPLARQGIQPVTYALDRALGYRASSETRTILHELAQRIFPQENKE
ncbi:Cobalamin synthase [Pseudodesulfovibrio profundus]|uniref:Cobalamin synthase n=1 Tax=Pseudodesulfovibrio profundus TaxID=57320 RepID=A0A2C8F813_9BACT|nr:AAA family ATPase [Pseudodesulfovibrio profundus]SOB58156.1 Cobalamin synthase [Pseudodesulfovibrio profundus]